MSKNLIIHFLQPGICHSIDDLAAELGIPNKAVTRGAAALIQDGYLIRRERGCFELSEKGIAAKGKEISFTSGPNGKKQKPSMPKRRTLKDNIWAALRIKNKATLEDLLFVATIDGQISSPGNARAYLKHLRDAGIVRLMSRKAAGEAPTSNGFNRYMLVNNLGPKTPYFSRVNNKIFDPNSEAFLEVAT